MQLTPIKGSKSLPGLAMAFCSPNRLKVQRHAGAMSVARAPHIAGATIVAQASSGRTSGAMPQRSFSVMQSAMKIPGLASALHLIGVNGPSGNATSAESTVAAAGSGASGGGPPAPEDPSASSPSSPLNHLSKAAGAMGSGSAAAASGAAAAGEPAPAAPAATDAADAIAAAAKAVYEIADAASASNNGNGHAPLHANGHEQQQREAYQAATSARQLHGHANGVTRLRGGGGGSSDLDDIPLSVMDSGSRAGNNITPYTGGLPSLAGQIREIASTLRQINSLRLEYLDKISQQELELAAKDQVLRSREERIQSLEQEAAELRRSLAMLHTAKAAAEGEVQRLRAAAAAAPPAPALRATASLSSPPALPPSAALPTTEVTAAPVTTAAAAPSPPAPPPPPPAPAAPPPPHPLTAPPAAVAASAPATIAAPQPPPVPTPPPTPAPPPAPPPPPPPRVPEIVVLYRSSWSEAFLHVNVDGRGWTAVPGLRMEHAGNKEYSLRVQGRSIEFVLTNGQGEWDSPGGGGIGRNYRIDTPGEYRLHYGAVTQVKPWQP